MTVWYLVLLMTEGPNFNKIINVLLVIAILIIDYITVVGPSIKKKKLRNSFYKEPQL